jgi:hypothetical protein
MSGLNLALAEHANGGLPAFRNLFMNPEFNINQRGFAGGSVGGFCYDRWSVWGTSATATASSGVITLSSGANLSQCLESPNLAGKVITVSVEDPTVNIDVKAWDYATTVHGDGTITAGSGRRSCTITVPAGATTHVPIYFYMAHGAGSFSKPQVERGAGATPFAARPIAVELMMCQRYYEASKVGTIYFLPTTLGSIRPGAPVANFKVRKRATPTVIIRSAHLGTANTVENVNTGLDVTVAAVYGADEGGASFFDITPSLASPNSVRWHWTADAEL